MAYADYLHCEVCDGKTLYTGEMDLPDPEPVIFCRSCWETIKDRFA